MSVSVQWSRRAALALVLIGAFGVFAPANAQATRAAQRAAKKGIVQQQGEARRRMAAEDFIMRLVEQPADRRRKMLDENTRFQRLPEAERGRILARLKQIDEMPALEREQLLERYHLFSRLPADKRDRARQIYRDWAKLPGDRRRMMTRAVARLRGLEPSQRAKALESGAMTGRFSAKERALIGDIANLAPPPGRP